MHRTHIMIDIETLGRTPRAPILSIGAVLFTLEEGLLESFYVPVRLDVTRYQADASTIEWWAGQPPEASKVFTDPDRVLPAEACQRLTNFVGALPGLFNVWAKPPRFDVAILENMLDTEGYPTPWGHRDVLDMRTLVALKDPKGTRIPMPVGTEHNALDDARWQATYVHTLLTT